MKNSKPLEVIFRHDKNDETKLNEAFDLLFEEVFRFMSGKPIMAIK